MRDETTQLEWEQQQMTKLEKLTDQELNEFAEGLDKENNELNQLYGLAVHEMAKRIAREL